ncbi:hypothetical protein B0T18DRAFT_417269 [Schizothecium vesticola]|uniref:Cysteine proteinase n=1 Tax=Schizothecium vesticola TaxID=314040 RepID=A0AA40EI46_9PEZI|nr:hypothetical protein B0T18DRAFT_417269 [Schizothecium vesticola]
MSAKTPDPIHTGTGYIADEFDARDLEYKYSGSKTAEQLTFADIRSQYPKWPVLDQGRTSTCVANATASVLHFLVYTGRVTHNEGAPGEFSRLFIYYNARAIAYMQWAKKKEWPETVEDTGSHIRNAFKTIGQLGASSEDACPWRVENGVTLGLNERPKDEAYAEAEKVHAIEYYRLDPDHTPEAEKNFTTEQKDGVGELTLLRVKQCLDEGFPVIFGFNYYWKTFTTNSTGPDSSGFYTLATLKGVHEAPPKNAKGFPVHGAHAVIAVAFDDSKKCILCKNSWGPDKSKYPWFWMPYAWVLDFEATDDFWTIRGLSSGPSPTRLSVPKPNTVNLKDPSYKLTTLPWTMTTTTSPNATIGAVCPSSDTAVVWITTPTGELQSAVYTSNGGWSQGGGVTDQHASTGPISMLSHGPGQKRLFFISADRAVQTMVDWPPENLAHAEGASVSGGLASVSRFLGHEEVFWVAPNGSIQAKYRYADQGQNWKPFEFAPEGSAHPDSSLAAVASANGKEMFVWWTTPDGYLTGMRWVDDGTNLWWRRLTGNFETKSAVKNGRIATVVQGITCSVYWFGTNGEVFQAVCRGGTMTDGDVAGPRWARVDSGLVAVERGGETDVVWVGPDNSLCLVRGQGNPTALTGSGEVKAGSPLGAFTRMKGQYSVLFGDWEGRVRLVDCLN